MSDFVSVTIHASQFPGNVRHDLLESLRTRRLNHKFLYESFRQSQKWLALHEAVSPARNDPDCLAVYDAAFRAVAARLGEGPLHLVALGCGSGQKEARLLELLRGSNPQLTCTEVDVSLPLLLAARQAALASFPQANWSGLVCDLASSELGHEAIAPQAPIPAPRLTTCFGLIPNFEPQVILPRLAAWTHPGDLLLLSANLAPGTDYAAGLARILPQYDNPLTRDWLLTFLWDLGFAPEDGELKLAVEDVRLSPSGLVLKRIVASFHFSRRRQLQVYQQLVEFNPGDAFGLFFSYRYTPGLLARLLNLQRLRLIEQWVTRSEEEGILLCEAI